MLLDSVVHAVTDKVHERILEAVHDGFVHLGVLALHYEFNVLVELFLHVADDTVHLLEYACQRYHSDGHYGILEFACELLELTRSLIEAFKLQTLEVGV